MDGRGVVQVDRRRAQEVWYALRGGWHYHVARTGVISGEPKKNIHSHPGDAMGYGAAILFPMTMMGQRKAVDGLGRGDGPGGSDFGGYFSGSSAPGGWRIGPGGANLPSHGSKLDLGDN